MATRKKRTVKKKHVASAADELDAEPSLRTGPLSFFDLLDDAVKEELLEIRRRYKLNACGGKSMSQVRTWCVERWGFVVGREAFSNWLRAE